MEMKIKKYFLIIGIFISCTILIGTNTIIATEENEYVSNEEIIYNHAFVIVETFSTSGSITGIPVNEYVGGLSDLDITTNGGSISLFFTVPIWGSSINHLNQDVHVHMDHFIGVTAFYSCGTGCIVGLCKNITWEII